jgi:outer membrane protein insertion porin family
LRAIGWLLGLVLLATSVRAETLVDRAALDVADPPREIVGFEVRGKTKLRLRALRYITFLREGDLVRHRDLPRIKQFLITSELFEEADASLEDAPGGGVIVVATVKDKHSWVIAPTVWFLAGKRSIGVGYAENNLFGNNQKLLLYGQVGDRESLFFGTFLDESVHGTRYTMRLDLYAYDRNVEEYLNPTGEPTSREIARISKVGYVAGAALFGYNLAWWAIADLRLRIGYVAYRDAHTPEGTPLPDPMIDGRDAAIQGRITLDNRQFYFGVNEGSYLQLQLHRSIPELCEYDYAWALFRAYRSLRLLGEHQFETRLNLAWGRDLPIHDDWLLGGASDLRGYIFDQFRGDVRAIVRTEYSVPLARYKFLAFRAITFWDSGYIGWRSQRQDGSRIYLPTQVEGASWFRNDVGIGFRVYVRRVVLPLLGFDVAYGLEGESPNVYFQLGLTDF